MNLIQIHTTDSINVEEEVQMFIRKSPQRLFLASQAFTKTKDLNNFYSKF